MALDKLRLTSDSWRELAHAELARDGIRVRFKIADSSNYPRNCTLRFDTTPIAVVKSPGVGFYVNVPHDCVANQFWQNQGDAEAFAHAFVSLRELHIERDHSAELSEFAARVSELRPRASDDLPEDLRRYRVQAEDAVANKRFEDAADLYAKALAAAPWWADGHPQAADARDAADRIYAWEGRAERRADALPRQIPV